MDQSALFDLRSNDASKIKWLLRQPFCWPAKLTEKLQKVSEAFDILNANKTKQDISIQIDEYDQLFQSIYPSIRQFLNQEYEKLPLEEKNKITNNFGRTLNIAFPNIKALVCHIRDNRIEKLIKEYDEMLNTLSSKTFIGVKDLIPKIEEIKNKLLDVFNNKDKPGLSLMIYISAQRFYELENDLIKEFKRIGELILHSLNIDISVFDIDKKTGIKEVYNTFLEILTQNEKKPDVPKHIPVTHPGTPRGESKDEGEYEESYISSVPEPPPLRAPKWTFRPTKHTRLTCAHLRTEYVNRSYSVAVEFRVKPIDE